MINMTTIKLFGNLIRSSVYIIEKNNNAMLPTVCC